MKRFIEKLDIEAIKIDGSLVVDEPFVLITYTTGMGLVPSKTTQFLEHNNGLLRGVASSGNRNWGLNVFAKAADILSRQYGVPLIHKFELAGTKSDVEFFLERLREIEQ